MITISTVLCRSGGGGDRPITFCIRIWPRKLTRPKSQSSKFKFDPIHCTNDISQRTSRVRRTKGSFLGQRNDRRENYDRLETISLKKKNYPPRGKEKGPVEAWGKPRFIQVRAPIAKWWKREESVERGESP